MFDFDKIGSCCKHYFIAGLSLPVCVYVSRAARVTLINKVRVTCTSEANHKMHLKSYTQKSIQFRVIHMFLHN